MANFWLIFSSRLDCQDAFVNQNKVQFIESLKVCVLGQCPKQAMRIIDDSTNYGRTILGTGYDSASETRIHDKSKFANFDVMLFCFLKKLIQDNSIHFQPELPRPGHDLFQVPTRNQVSTSTQ